MAEWHGRVFRGGFGSKPAVPIIFAESFSNYMLSVENPFNAPFMVSLCNLLRRGRGQPRGDYRLGGIVLVLEPFGYIM